MSGLSESERGLIEERASPDRLQADPEDRRRLTGRAIVFHSLSRVIVEQGIGQFREVINPDAVDRTLRDPSLVKALWNHNPDMVLGAVRSGTLRLMKTGTGLFVHIHPPQWAGPQMESVERGDVDGMSFRFKPMDGFWDHRTADGIPTREITDMEIREVSVVTFPAYPEARLSQRSIDEFYETRSQQLGRSIDWYRKVHQTRMAR